jgi:hypothetical protein
MVDMARRSGFVILGLLVFGVLPSAVAVAYEAWGWGEIRPALVDGDGAEFIVPIHGWGPNEFTGATEMEAVQAAANWVASHMVYVSDPDPPGDVWTASDQQYEEIVMYGFGSGDCEDFSILLCALLRFHTQGGIPADRVWVQGGVIAVPGQELRPPVFGHAYVVYKAPKRGIFYIEPQWGGLPYRGAFPSILHWYFTPPPQTGESAMLRFNDVWVKGGGFWLAGRR